MVYFLLSSAPFSVHYKSEGEPWPMTSFFILRYLPGRWMSRRIESVRCDTNAKRSLHRFFRFHKPLPGTNTFAVWRFFYTSRCDLFLSLYDVYRRADRKLGIDSKRCGISNGASDRNIIEFFLFFSQQQFTSVFCLFYLIEMVRLVIVESRHRRGSPSPTTFVLTDCSWTFRRSFAVHWDGWSTFANYLANTWR